MGSKVLVKFVAARKTAMCSVHVCILSMITLYTAELVSVGCRGGLFKLCFNQSVVAKSDCPPPPHRCVNINHMAFDSFVEQRQEQEGILP